MGKALIITEKPSVARDIAAALDGFTEHDGYFESDDYVLTFAVGHLFELLTPEEVDPAYKRWTLDVLPMIPERFTFKPKSGQSDRIRTIKNLITRADVDRVVNACDAGREGELIFREIVNHFNTGKPIERLWLQSMTTDAIREGFGALQPGADFEGLAAAAECRSFSDWLIGMNATRALTKRMRSRKEGGAWSAGRVQTPTLALLVARELEVLAHQPRPYWRIVGQFDHDGSPYTGTWFDPGFKAGEDDDAKDDRIFDSARAQAVLAAVSGAPGAAEETRKPSRESAPPLFDLTSLQREANGKLGWSARRTLSAAQRCYEGHKLLTYPRTDSRCLPADYRGTVDQVLASLAGAPKQSSPIPLADYARGAETLIRNGRENEGKIFDNAGVSDHFAIIPTGTLPSDSLSGDDRRLYDLVVRRFLAAFHPPAWWERVERVTTVEGHRFRSRARVLQTPGWRAVMPQTSSNDEAEPLRPLAPGENEASGVSVGVSEVKTEEEETKPPPRITEARLLSLMENAGKQIDDEDIANALHEKGIGTPATRAEIIENLIAKGYVVRLGKALRPSVKGIRLIDCLRRIHIDRLSSPELTGELEFHLRQVEHGERTADDFMAEIIQYTRDVVERAKTFGYEEMYQDDEPLGPCPRCGRPVRESSWFYRCEEVPDAEEDCPLRFWKDNSGRYLNRQVVETLIKDGKTGVIDGFTARNGRTYKGSIEIDRDEWKLQVQSAGWNEGEGTSDIPEYEVDTDPLGQCPLCEEHPVVETSTTFECESRLKEMEEAEAKRAAEEAAEAKAGEDKPKKRRKKVKPSCGYIFPRTVCKREITRDEALYYLQNRRTELLTDFTSRFGRPFSATLVLKETGRHGFEFPPRKARGKADGDAGAPAKAGGTKRRAAAKTTRKRKTTKKKTGKKKTTRKKKATKKARKKKSAKPSSS